MLLTSIGKMIRVDMNTIRKQGRNTSGVNYCKMLIKMTKLYQLQNVQKKMKKLN